MTREQGNRTTRTRPLSEQLDIFSVPVATTRKHRRTDPSTSARAAARVAPRAGSQRARILQAVLDSGARGLTYDDVAQATGIVGVSTSTRISELARDGWIDRAGERETSAGGRAVVWVAAAKAHAALAEAA